MKNLLFFCILLMPFALFSQDKGYTQLESIMLTPEPGQMAKLRTNMRAHNLKYHAKAPYTAMVFNIATGLNSGKLVWMMGPCTFTELDSRPSAGGHDEDWGKNVVPYLKEMTNVEYWRRDDDLTVNAAAPDQPPSAMIRVRYQTVTPGEGYRVDDLLAKIKATLIEMGIEEEWAVWDNQFRQGTKNGRHMAIVSAFNSWSWMDEDNNFGETFNKLYGEGAIQRFGREMANVFSDTWDEFWTVDKFMSGFPE